MINTDVFDTFLPEFERPKMSARLHTAIALLLLAAAPAAYAQTPATSAPPGDSTSRCPCQMMKGCKGGGGMDQMGGMHQMGEMHQRGGMGGMGMMGGMNHQGMPMPSAADNARLDSLVTAMHQTRGDKKLGAMEKVIDELLGQRKLMQEHMRKMTEMDHTQHE